MAKIWKDWKKTKITYPNRKHLTLSELDKIPYYDENNDMVDNKKNEREEQYICHDYINNELVVLELGGRYGTVSCVINNKLENPLNHIVIEPDKSVIDALKKNRKTHKSKFKIINGIISKKKMKLNKNGYASNVSECNDVANEEERLKTYSLKKIMNKYNLKFDTLVADCEGCLCDFINENKKYIKHYKLIIFERDMPNNCNYESIDKQLLNWNFTKVIDGFVCVWKNDNYKHNYF